MRIATVLILAAAAAAGCADPVKVIGRPGRGPGEFDEPRALAVSEHGLAVVDRSGRLQLFDLDGRPTGAFAVADGDVRRGFPCGVTWLPDGTLVLADTHRSALTFYDTAGRLLRHVGGMGAGPGEFIYPERVLPLPDGGLAVSEYGVSTANRVQIFDRDGEFVRKFGGPAQDDGGLTRPMGLVRRDDGSFVLADQLTGLRLFTPGGGFAGPFAPRATPAGSMPYGLCRDPGGTIYMADLALDRLVRITPQGEVTGIFGGSGVEPGRFRRPWDVAWHAGRLYVADRENHRVQRFEVSAMEWRTD